MYMLCTILGTLIISINKINERDFLTERQYIFCEAETELLNITYMNYSAPPFLRFSPLEIPYFGRIAAL
jgi:hypothetical protein